MSSETTKKQIERLDNELETARRQGLPAVAFEQLCQAKLALVQALEIQERMERPDSRCSCGSKPDWKNRDGRLYCMACWRRYVDENPGARAVNLKLCQDGSAGGGE
jgi:hypothetical protein